MTYPSSIPTFVDFFAGSGLVTQGVKHACTPIWSNDICPKKAEVYRANHGNLHFHLCPIENVDGAQIPTGDIVWASFPCQDLSLAGKMGGLEASRSGLFWEWLRVLDSMNDRPPVLALENVTGLLSANKGADYRLIHNALQERGYRIGPMLLDARRWLPQSRPRVFIVAVRSDIDTANLEDSGPNWAHPELVTRAVSGLSDVIFWSLPEPKSHRRSLSKLIDWDAPTFERERTDALLSIISSKHKERLQSITPNQKVVFPGYRRTRNGKQVLELRFDDISGCLRTAEGGSSRQFLIIHQKGEWTARLITAREAASLMGAPQSFKLPASYNQSYNAMGDAVAVPIVKHLTDHLFVPLLQCPELATVSNKSSATRPILSA